MNKIIVNFIDTCISIVVSKWYYVTIKVCTDDTDKIKRRWIRCILGMDEFLEGITITLKKKEITKF